jgi:hypothetical protein
MTNSNGNSSQDGTWLHQVTEVTKDGVLLLQQELQLARQETVEKLKPVLTSTGLIAAGGIMAAVGSTYLMQAVVHLLATRMPHWVASLLAGVGFTVGGIVLVQTGSRQIKELDVVPQKTISSLREDREWLITQIKSRLI